LVDEPHASEDAMTKKEIAMSAHAHTTLWGTHLGIGRTTDAKGWYQQLKTWWADHKAARRAAHLAALNARWDARHEAVRTVHADAAVDVMAQAHACSTSTALCYLSS
jgi:hypothetical protein